MDKKYLEEKEKFKESGLYRLIDQSIDGSIFV
jgi:hypothetical protein